MTIADWFELVRTLGVVVGAAAAIVGVHKYWTEINAVKRQRWQKTTVQAIIQSEEDRITFDQLKQAYRSFAADHMNKLLKTGDISDEALRNILIDLCSDNVIVQLGRDTYSLTTYPGQIEKAQGINAEMLQLQKTFFEAQLEFLAKQDETIREMLEQQKLVTASMSGTDLFQARTIREVK